MPSTNWLSVNRVVINLKSNPAHLLNISKLFATNGLINKLAGLPHNLDLSNLIFVMHLMAH